MNKRNLRIEVETPRALRHGWRCCPCPLRHRRPAPNYRTSHPGRGAQAPTPGFLLPPLHVGQIWWTCAQICRHPYLDPVGYSPPRWSSCRPCHRAAHAAPRHHLTRMWIGALHLHSLHMVETTNPRTTAVPPLLQRRVAQGGRGGLCAPLPYAPPALPCQLGHVPSINRWSRDGLGCRAGGRRGRIHAPYHGGPAGHKMAIKAMSTHQRCHVRGVFMAAPGRGRGAPSRPMFCLYDAARF